jgi:sulfonate transport system substrate-binding protein
MRHLLVAGVLLGAVASATAQTTLRVGDQKGNSQAVMEAAGVLKDVPYRIEWKEFPAAAPLLEALGAGAIETGVVGDAPFTFAAAANLPVKAIGAIRQSQEGLAILVPRESKIQNFEDLRGKKIATGRGSIGHQLVLAAMESKGWSAADMQIVFLAPSDAKDRLHPGVGRCLVDMGALCQPGRSAVSVAARDHGRGTDARNSLSGCVARCHPRQAAGA